MIICIIICIIANIVYLFMKDVSDNNIANTSSKVSQGKIKMTNTLLTILIAYILFLLSLL